MTQDKHEDDLLEGLFEDARAHPPLVPDALMAWVIADAEAVQPDAPRQGLRGWIASFGGLPALGGLVTATCVGFWLGVAPPAAVPDLASVILGGEFLAEGEGDTTELSGFGWDMEEGQADG